LNIARAKLAALSLLATVVFLCGGEDARAQQDLGGNPEQPEVAAEAWVLVDARSGEHLAGEDASERLPVASTAKIMTSLVTLEQADLDEVATVSEDATSFAVPLYSNVGLYPGDTLTVRELLMAAMISSGDDATYALAEHVGGGGEAGVESFVAEMNREATELGLSDTRFENPIGLDARGQYSSAGNLAKMVRATSKHPEFREMVGTEYAEITTQDRVIPLTNTNELLSAYGPATGVKTGTTPAAGECLVASAASGDESYVAVVLDARRDRFASSIGLLRHGFAAYDRRDLVGEDRRYARAGVPFRRDEKVELVAAKNVEGLVDGASEVEREVNVVGELPPSAKPGTRLGEVVVRVDGERVGESPLVAKKGYEEASLGDRVWYTVGGLFE
jgi:D-alanyl-D-alanine carboxypeptidase (penicillin-binding protein 5/6)